MRILLSEEMVAEFVGLAADSPCCGTAKTRRVVLLTKLSEETCSSPLVVSSCWVWRRHRSRCRCPAPDRLPDQLHAPAVGCRSRRWPPRRWMAAVSEGSRCERRPDRPRSSPEVVPPLGVTTGTSSARPCGRGEARPSPWSSRMGYPPRPPCIGTVCIYPRDATAVRIRPCNPATAGNLVGRCDNPPRPSGTTRIHTVRRRSTSTEGSRACSSSTTTRHPPACRTTTESTTFR